MPALIKGDNLVRSTLSFRLQKGLLQSVIATAEGHGQPAGHRATSSGQPQEEPSATMGAGVEKEDIGTGVGVGPINNKLSKGVDPDFRLHVPCCGPPA